MDCVPYLILTLTTVILVCELEASENVCDICNCYEPATVDCSKHNLTNVPNGISATTTVLDMSSNHITNLKDFPFKELKNLNVLDLSNNYLTLDSNTTFNGLTKLKVLNISNNDQLSLTNVTTPLLLFEGLSSLEVLKMYGTTGTYNVQEGYPGEQLTKLTSLKELWIDGREHIFGEEFRNISTLRILRLAGDYIEPPWRSLEYCMMNIEKGMLDTLVSITHLYIRKCNVAKVDKDSFKGLQNLQYLDLSLNTMLTIKGITSAFGSLPNHTDTLVLNSIESVKPNKYTVVLTTELAESLSQIPLRELHLDNNRIELIDEDVFKKLPKTLQIISLKRNKFYPEYYLFSTRYMENLTDLDVSYQSFTKGWAVLQPPVRRDSNKEVGSTIVNGSMEDIFELNVTGKGRKYPLPMDSEMDWRSGSLDYILNVMIGTESDNTSLVHNVTPLGAEGDFSQRYSMNYNDWLYTCPLKVKEFYIPPGTVISYLPPKLEHLKMSVSRLAGPISQLVFSKNNSLKTLNVSQSLLYCWQGPVVGLEKLQVLDLSQNNCYNVSVNFFNFTNNLKELYLQGNILGSVFARNYASEILAPLTSLEVVNIAYNRVYKISNNFFLSQQHLIKLFAYANVMEKFDVKIGHMTKLRELNLTLNYISSLSETTRHELESISANIETENWLIVDLRSNPIHCYCYNIDFLTWLLKINKKNDTLVIKISECLFQKNLSRVTIASTDHFEYMINELQKSCTSYVGLIVGLTIFLALVINIVLGIIVHRHRWQIQYWYHVVFRNYNFRIRLRKSNYEEILDPYKYDVFVASSSDHTHESLGNLLEDEDFVMDKLRRVLRANNLVAFVQVYHILGNGNLIGQIGRAMHSSRVVLFVFTKDWHSDAGMKVAVSMWQCDSVNRTNKNTILGVKLDEMTGADADMIQDLFCSKIMDYPNCSNNHENETFWRECTSQIQQLARRNNGITSSQL